MKTIIIVLVIINILLIVLTIFLVVFRLNRPTSIIQGLSVIDGFMVLKRGSDPEQIQRGDIIMGIKDDKFVIGEREKNPNVKNEYSYYLRNDKSTQL